GDRRSAGGDGELHVRLAEPVVVGGDGGERGVGAIVHLRWIWEHDGKDGDKGDRSAGVFDDDQSGHQWGTDELHAFGGGWGRRGEPAIRRNEGIELRGVHLRSGGKA